MENMKTHRRVLHETCSVPPMVNSCHGGNIYMAAKRYGLDEQEIIDFSASINPLGVPESVTAAIKDSIRRLPNYPDPDAGELTLAIAGHFEVDPQSVLCGNGSTELIYLVARALAPKKILVLSPTFSEYELAAGDAAEIVHHNLDAKDDFAVDPKSFINAMAGGHGSLSHNTAPAASIDMAILCNPNNPTGGILRKPDVLKIADAARDLQCRLVVDEAFVDFSPDDSLINEVENNPYLIILRSMTKFYAISGLRIGYGIFPPELIDLVKKHKEPWTVNTLAQAAGVAALKDHLYKEDTFRIIEAERKTLEDGFRQVKIPFFPSAANFYLIKMAKAQYIIDSLGRKGILIRDCSNFRGLGESYARIAVKSNKDNMRLLKELADLCRA
jgi:threonine-phosphate decarboxylase